MTEILSPQKLERSQSMLTAALLASEHADELRQLAAELETQARGLDGALQPLLGLHGVGIWSGRSARESRARLRHVYQRDLEEAGANVAEVVQRLRHAAGKAQDEADQLWAQWRLALYTGEIVSQFHYWG